MTQIIDPPAAPAETQRIVILPKTRPTTGRVVRAKSAIRPFLYFGRHRNGWFGSLIRWAVA